MIINNLFSLKGICFILHKFYLFSILEIPFILYLTYFIDTVLKINYILVLKKHVQLIEIMQ